MRDRRRGSLGKQGEENDRETLGGLGQAGERGVVSDHWEARAVGPSWWSEFRLCDSALWYPMYTQPLPI